jgi:hypothetical protein
VIQVENLLNVGMNVNARIQFGAPWVSWRMRETA